MGSRREFCLLAHTFDPIKTNPSGWFLSEKLDGCRAIWDSGVSRGMLASDVPWANTDRKGHLLAAPIATGLWSRSGNVINAPDWFLDKLPTNLLLDGELWSGVGNFQTLISAVKKHTPIDSEWKTVRYCVFDSPKADILFMDGTIKTTNFRKEMKDCASWFRSHGGNVVKKYDFEAIYSYLSSNLNNNNGIVQVHRQLQLPFNTVEAMEVVYSELDRVVEGRGEGLMLRKPTSIWIPSRSHDILKVKKLRDAEGTVYGYTWGKRTELGSKLLGLMGAVILNFKGKRLELSGFTDEEREMDSINTTINPRRIGEEHPGEVCDSRIYNPKFPLGSIVSFRYTELSDDGIPKFARYWRKA